MARRQSYVRDANGRFASTPGGGGGGKGGGGARGGKRQTGRQTTRQTGRAPGRGLGRAMVATARGKVRATEAKLATNNSPAQRGAVTKAKKKLDATKRYAVVRGPRVAGTIAKPKGLKPGALAARLQTRQAASGGRKRNLRAERAKAAANRTGVVSGKNFTHGQDVKTMSLAELRTAVRQHSRKGGPMSRKEFMYLYALPSGVVSTGKGGLEKGRMPRTRGDWEKIYKSVIGLPQAERNRKNRPGVINGIDIHGSFRPGAVFGLSMKTATPDDVNRAYRRLARQAHPDAGGRRRDFERLTQMRDSVLALMRDRDSSKTKSKGKGKGKGAAAPAAAAPRGPRMLPPAAQVPAAATGKPKQSRGGKAAAKPASAPAASAPVKPKGLKPRASAKGGAKPATRSRGRIVIARSQVPATTTNYRQALPAAPSNAARLRRARDIKQRATEGAVSFEQMKKLQTKASVANNPYSSMSKAERTKAINALARAELAKTKLDKSYRTAARAEDKYTNVVGYTEGGQRKWKRSGRRSTSMGAGTLRAGPLRSSKPKAPATKPAQSVPRRRSGRMWYESVSPPAPATAKPKARRTRRKAS